MAPGTCEVVRQRRDLRMREDQPAFRPESVMSTLNHFLTSAAIGSAARYLIAYQVNTR